MFSQSWPPASTEVLLTVDAETYYADGYSLRSMSYTDYLRDERFKLHGLGIQVDDQPRKWLTTEEELHAALSPLPWDRVRLNSHNLFIDGPIVTQHLGYHAAHYTDTLAMARAVHQGEVGHGLEFLMPHHGLGQKGKELAATKGLRDLPAELLAELGKYCLNDVFGCHELFRIFRPYFSDTELELLSITSRMFLEPVLKIDEDRARIALVEEQKKLDETVAASGCTLKELRSRTIFPEILRAKGVEPPTKINPKGNVTYAFAKTDLAFTDLLGHEDPEVGKLVRAKLASSSTIDLSRIKRMIRVGENDQLFPIALLYWGALATGRWSGTDKMNAQNWRRNSEMRKSVIAPEGWVLPVSDSAQIEARVLVWFADQLDILEAFRQERDIYSEFASDVYGRKVDRKFEDEQGNKPDAVEGFVGKVCVLGLGFGMGWKTFQRQLRIGMMGGPPVYFDDQTAQRVVNLYRQRNRNVQQLWQMAENWLAIMCHGGTTTYKGLTFTDKRVHLPNGMVLYYPQLAMDHNGNYSYWNGQTRTNIYGGKFIENIIQALARIVVGDQMLEIDKQHRVVHMTHDEVIACVPEELGAQATANMIRLMSIPPAWAPTLPVAAEGGFAREYSK